MKYAKLIKLGGELIPVDKADYSTYDGGLICPECGEDVFLRKSHTRANQEVSAAFCHKRAIPEVSVCELRVGRYTQQDVERMAGEARDQRRRKLQVSLWKYLKTNLSFFYFTECNLTDWSKSRFTWKNINNQAVFLVLLNLVKYTSKVFIDCESKQTLTEVFEDAVDKVSFILMMDTAVYHDIPECVKKLCQKRSSKDWYLHLKISKEVFDFLCSSANKEIIERFTWSLIDLQINFESLSDRKTQQDFLSSSWFLIDEEGKKAQQIYAARTLSLLVLTVDWIEIFDCKTPTKVLQHSSSRQKSA